MSDMWDSVASAWARNAAFVDEHLAAATQAMLDAAGVGEGSEVLDLASGPGGAGLAAAQRVGTSGRVVLADVSRAMVTVAERRSAGLSHVTAAPMDELAIGAPDATFDAVIIRHGLMFAEPPQAAVKEATRVLKPGGRYAAMTWDSRAANPWLGLILDAVGEQFGVPFPPPNIPGPFALDDPERLIGVLREGGLEDVTVQRIRTPMSAESLDAWWERVPQLAGPLAIALAGMEADVRDAIKERSIGYGRDAAVERDGAIEMAGAVLVGSGVRP